MVPSAATMTCQCREMQTSTNNLGYSLLEMLVVISIIALVTLSTPTAITKIIPNFQVRQFANDLAERVRIMRREAIQENSVKGFIYDPNTNVIAEFGGNMGAEGDTLAIPAGVSFTFEPASEWRSVPENRLEFYPSGAASGGVIKVERGTVSVDIEINWISGAVEVHQ